LPGSSSGGWRSASPITSEQPLAVRCTGLSKTYRLGEELSLRRSLAALVPGQHAPTESFHALDDVSFEIPRGEYFGIVGQNGSGKSTLTQVISGTVLPLLEVGAGFHVELTGRENIALLASILGLDASVARRETPRIAAFAGVERHLDTPIKRYSTGMQARLSFATAICFPADIYIFDEVLAVVDDDFRDRCARELADLNAQGRTVVFMSHDLELVRSMCSMGMWLDRGHVRLIGGIDEVATAYGRATAEGVASSR
jgi:ABC-type polysaccharide/polyol phosphate transport system ATPase subunit